jgi:glycosyltransferase involved in cell wall biosynthesis
MADAGIIAYPEVLSSGALLLALSLGLPVVALRDSSASEAVQPPALVTFEPGGLAEALVAMRSGPADDRRAAAFAAAERLSSDAAAERVHAAYQGRDPDSVPARRCDPYACLTATVPDRTAVVIPTRNRPEHLERCLAHLSRARGQHGFTAWVCDSSDARHQEAVRRICHRHAWVELRFHRGRNISAARNFCAQVADAQLLISVDDDVLVEPQAVRELVAAYEAGSGPRVVAGAVRWGRETLPLAPMVLRRIGYGRPVRVGEDAAFLNSSLFLYPRAYALRWPWNERIRRGSDVLMGAIWRRAGVRIQWAPAALALHEAREALNADQHDDYVYAVLAHLLIAAKRPLRLALLETLGVAAGTRRYGGRPSELRAYARGWVNGHVAFARDYSVLRELASRPVPALSTAAPSSSRTSPSFARRSE